ncbi:MAG: CBS domain-containing protein [Planctomycetota bacterium]
MWDHDCGCVPIEDEGRVIGILTDRDICMAAYTQGGALASLKVRNAMSSKVLVCHPDDAVLDAERLMRANRIRRLPVVDDTGRLVGIVSLNDLARAVKSGRGRKVATDITDQEVLDTLAEICQPRLQAGSRRARGARGLVTWRRLTGRRS